MKFGCCELKTSSLWRGCAAEFVGTTLLVLCITFININWNINTNSSNNLEVALCIGFAFTSIAHAFWHVSGGYLNPAVSVAMVTGGRIAVVKGFLFILAQLAGGIGLELLFSFLLIFYILSATDPMRRVESANAALGVGLTVAVSHLCLIPVTGCSLNPARSFGPAVLSNIWKYQWVFWVGPICGGISASILYNLIFYCDDNDDEVRKSSREYGVTNVHTNGHVNDNDNNTLRMESSNL